MPKVVTTYADNAGNPHNSLDDAFLADLSVLFGNNPGVAREVMKAQDKLEELFQQFRDIKKQAQSPGNGGVYRES